MTQYFMFLDFYLMLTLKENSVLPIEKIRDMGRMMKNAGVTLQMVNRQIISNFK